MVSKTTARNSTQRISTKPLNSRKILSPATYYTCPTGSKAVISGRATCTGLGAAASVYLNGAGIIIKEFQAADVKVPYDFEIQLAAGETLDYSQNAGANGELNVIGKIQESPV